MAETLSKLKKIQQETLAGLRGGWRATESEANASAFQKFIRFWAFVGRSFIHNRLPVRASSLAFTTLMAIVPLLAVAISISTGLLKTEQGEECIRDLVNTSIARFAPQLDLRVAEGDTNREQVVQTIFSAIENVQSGTLGVTAMILLLFISISLLSSVENTLNDIWGVVRGRTYLARIIQYWAVITLGPIFVLAAITLSATPHFQVQEWIPGAEIVTGFISEFIPALVFTAVFTLIYRLMPNTKVEWRAALIGGLVAGLLLYLNNKFSMIYFGQVVRNSKIYGSLGSVPVFLIGLYFSWMILLLGAQMAYAFQNRHAYFQEKQAENIHERGREFVALRIMTWIAERFSRGERPPTISEISEHLAIPSRLISRIVEPLLLTRLIVEVKAGEEGESAYDPGRPLENISYQDILEAMRAGIGQDLPTRDDDMRKLVSDQFENIHKAESKIGSTITLRDLVAQQTKTSTS